MWKVSKYRVFSGPYFPVFGLNTEIYRVTFYRVKIYRFKLVAKTTLIAIFRTFFQRCTAWKLSKYGVFSGPHFAVFTPNTGKCRPEKFPVTTLFTQCEVSFFSESPEIVFWMDSAFLVQHNTFDTATTFDVESDAAIKRCSRNIGALRFHSEAYLGSCQTSKKQLHAENSYYLTIFRKSLPKRFGRVLNVPPDLKKS